MGSPASELGRDNDETQHTVTLTHAFWLKATEVLQFDWERVMGSNPSHSKGCGSSSPPSSAGTGRATRSYLGCPVERVSWYEVVAYCNALSRKEGLERCYVAGGKEYDASSAAAEQAPSWPKGLGCLGYRLPSEAEWEYAARAGTATAFYTGDITEQKCKLDANLDKAAWYCGNAGGTTHPVKQKAPNAWGLYDMLGNVWEWVWDWKADYGAGPKRDPVGPVAGSHRVVRGGSRDNNAGGCRAAARSNDSPSFRFLNVFGFRPARSIP